MLANGDQDPVWITEFGLATCPSLPHCVSEGTQARYIDRALTLAARWNYVDVFLIFRLRDSFGSVPLLAFTFGLLDRDWSKKPAATTVRDRFVALRRASRR
jgi:hypothetical protein